MVKISGMAAKYNVFSSQIKRVQNTIVQHHDQNTTHVACSDFFYGPVCPLVGGRSVGHNCYLIVIYI